MHRVPAALVVCLSLVGLAPLARAEGEKPDAEAAVARALVDRAVIALGGAKALGGGLTGRSKGTGHLGDARVELTNEWSVAGHDRLRWRAQGPINGSEVTILLVMNGDKAWVSGNGQPGADFPKEPLAVLQADFRAVRLGEDPRPLLNKDTTLSPLGELKIDDTPAVGVKVVRKGWPDVDLFFTKTTGLPLRAEFRLKEREGGEEVTQTITFGRYRKVSGRQVPALLKLERDGKAALEMERTDIKVVEVIDPDQFARP